MASTQPVIRAGQNPAPWFKSMEFGRNTGKNGRSYQNVAVECYARTRCPFGHL